MTRFDYYSDWCSLTYPETNEVSLDSDIMLGYRRVELESSEKYSSGGVPLLVKDGCAYVNDRNENMLIFGETGCKKSRSVISPLIATTAGAGETAFITDVKGELYANRRLRGFLEDRGVRTVCLDLRTFDCDGYNIFEYPYKLYRNGNRDKALSVCKVILNSLAEKYDGSEDPFWHETAASYLMGLIELMFLTGSTIGCHDKVNMISLAHLAGASMLEHLRKLSSAAKNIMRMSMTVMGYNGLENVMSNTADRTVSCILSFAYTIIMPFMTEPKVARMMSHSTFDVDSLYEIPTAVFLIIPDETSAYEKIAGILIDNFYTRLVEKYSIRYMSRSESPCRINFICDEFCNLHINDMKAKISASRGRNMRWFLVCQSKVQLEDSYGINAGTILGNCRNTLFLQSCDETLLTYISRLCGETEVCEGSSEWLITDDMLRGLRKEKDFKEALFMDGNVRYFAKLPDIDSYDFLKKYEYTTGRKKPTKVQFKANEELRYIDNDDIYEFLCSLMGGEEEDLFEVYDPA